MTDTPPPGASPCAPAPAPDKPIEVKASAAPIVTSETYKLLVMAGGAFLADRLLHSDIAIAAVVPVFAIVATWTWSLMHRLHSWRAFRFLVDRVPDDVARVGAKPWWVFW